MSKEENSQHPSPNPNLTKNSPKENSEEKTVAL